MNTKHAGDFAELLTAAKFAEKGYYVSLPMTDNAPYDLIVDFQGRLHKVQVKSRSRVGDIISVQMYSSMRGYKYFYKDGDFDILVVHDKISNELAMLFWDDIKDLSSLTLRLSPAKNNQTKGIKLFADYLL